MEADMKMPETPDERIKLIADYTKNDAADIKRFIGAAEACGFIFMRRDIHDEALRIIDGFLANYDPESAAILVEPNPGCLECTAGTTPNHLNTGLCTYHQARAFIEKWGAR